MHVGKKTLKREKSAMSLSLYGSLVFAIVEIGMAVFSGSQAVLLDAVYDSVEFFMMLPSIFLIPLLYRPSSEQHPFGYTQIETGFVVVKGAIMAAVTFGLIFNNIHLLLHGGHKVSFHTISSFELFACLLSLTVAICLYFKNKHMSSPLVNIELQTWKIDAWYPWEWRWPSAPDHRPLCMVSASDTVPGSDHHHHIVSLYAADTDQNSHHRPP